MAEKILGLSPGYGEEDLSRAYRRLAARCHPDAAMARGEDPAGASETMARVNEARDLLAAGFSRSSARAAEWRGRPGEAPMYGAVGLDDIDRFVKAVHLCRLKSEPALPHGKHARVPKHAAKAAPVPDYIGFAAAVGFASAAMRRSGGASGRKGPSDM